MSTKNKILDNALYLFNNKGVAATSIRDIANRMGISDGNLRYHFRTRDELIEALFDRLADKIGLELAQGAQQELNIRLMYDVLEHLMKNFYDYRFLMKDLNAIIQTHPKTKNKFYRITEERLMLVNGMIAQYVDKGFMKPEPYQGHYTRLVENILIVSHFWINGSELFYRGKKSGVILHYTNTIFSLMHPYLTEKALAELKQMANDIK